MTLTSVEASFLNFFFYCEKEQEGEGGVGAGDLAGRTEDVWETLLPVLLLTFYGSSVLTRFSCSLLPLFFSPVLLPHFLPPDTGNYGATLCHLFIFTAKRDGDTYGGDETFLETENRELSEKNQLQTEAIARLEKENNLIKEAAELERRLLNTSLLQAETNSKLLKAKKESMNHNAKATLLSALTEIRKPLGGVMLGLDRIFTGSLTGLRIDDELKYISICAHHQKLLIKSAVDLDTFVTGNKKFKTSEFSPAQLCREVVALQSLSAREGVDIVLSSTLSEGNFSGNPSQLSLVLSNLLSSAATAPGAGKVELSADVVEDYSTFQIICFTVTNDGREVPEYLLQFFFGSPGQLGNEREQIRTFGFAVYVAHEFVKRMRGVLRLHSPAFITKERKGGFGLEPVTEPAEGEGGEGGAGGGGGGGGGFELTFRVRVDKTKSGEKGGRTEAAGEHRRPVNSLPSTATSNAKERAPEREQEQGKELVQEQEEKEEEEGLEQEQERGREESSDDDGSSLTEERGTDEEQEESQERGQEESSYDYDRSLKEEGGTGAWEMDRGGEQLSKGREGEEAISEGRESERAKVRAPLFRSRSSRSAGSKVHALL